MVQTEEQTTLVENDEKYDIILSQLPDLITEIRLAAPHVGGLCTKILDLIEDPLNFEHIKST